jgi:hypothetical protein
MEEGSAWINISEPFHFEIDEMFDSPEMLTLHEFLDCGSDSPTLSCSGSHDQWTFYEPRLDTALERFEKSGKFLESQMACVPLWKRYRIEQTGVDELQFTYEKLIAAEEGLRIPMSDPANCVQGTYEMNEEDMTASTTFTATAHRVD